jgi:hypothetical protein
MTMCNASDNAKGINTLSVVALTAGDRRQEGEIDRFNDAHTGPVVPGLLTQVNGRVGTPLCRARAKPAPTIEYALLELAAIARRRRQRGYELTS